MSILDKLKRVVSFDVSPSTGSVIATEGCDYYYSEILSKDEFRELISEMEEIYKSIPDEKTERPRTERTSLLTVSQMTTASLYALEEQLKKADLVAPKAVE